MQARHDLVGTSCSTCHFRPRGIVDAMEQSLLFAAKGLLNSCQGRGEYANSVNANMSADNLDQVLHL